MKQFTTCGAMLTVVNLLDMMHPSHSLCMLCCMQKPLQSSMVQLQTNSIRIIHMVHLLQEASDTKSCHVAEAVRVAFDFFSQRAALGFAIPEWLPTPNNLQYHAAVSQLDSAVYGIIEDRKQQLSALQTSSWHSQVDNNTCNGLHPDLSALHCA